MSDQPPTSGPADPHLPGDAQPVRREPVFNLAPVALALIAICVGVHLVRVYALSFDQDLSLLVRTAFIPIRYSGQFDLDIYAVTSTVTYSFLHGGLAHLAINMIWLAAFGSPLANRIGTTRFLAFWAITAVAAAGLHWVVHPADQAPLVGASGAISGMMAAAARFGFRIDRSRERPALAGQVLPVGAMLRSRGVMTFLAVWFVLNLVIGLAGFMPGAENRIAWEAHIGGFIAGFALIRALDRRPKATRP
jgi:membrane associated rhomboid family serine protease